MRNTSRGGFTLVELLVVIAIIGILIALLLPAVQAARESARRTECTNKLKQIGLAVLHYEESLSVYPPGCIVSTGSNLQWDPVSEAGNTSGGGLHGTSWLLQLLPHIEQENLYKKWDFTTNVRGNAVVAQTDLPIFYCPTRRNRIRPGDERMLLVGSWKGGGTDYGGCVGSGNAFNNDTAAHPFANGTVNDEDYFHMKRMGMFQPNKSIRNMQVRDGTSNTIMAGEMQRLWDGSVTQRQSRDGWALGGVATLFSTADSESGGTYQTGGLNNEFFESPGSEHPSGANFCLGDGSVQFINENIDRMTFRYLGSMYDGESVTVPTR